MSLTVPLSCKGPAHLSLSISNLRNISAQRIFEKILEKKTGVSGWLYLHYQQSETKDHQENHKRYEREESVQATRSQRHSAPSQGPLVLAEWETISMGFASWHLWDQHSYTHLKRGHMAPDTVSMRWPRDVSINSGRREPALALFVNSVHTMCTLFLQIWYDWLLSSSIGWWSV